MYKFYAGKGVNDMQIILNTWRETAYFYFVENIVLTVLTILMIPLIIIYLVFIFPRLAGYKKNDKKTWVMEENKRRGVPSRFTHQMQILIYEPIYLIIPIFLLALFTQYLL